MSQLAWVVVGECGEYSDHMMWWVAAFSEKSDAEYATERLNKWCKRHNLHEDCDSVSYDYGCSGEIENAPPWDPGFMMGYTGVNYSCAEMPLDPRWGWAEIDMQPDEPAPGNRREMLP